MVEVNIERVLCPLILPLYLQAIPSVEIDFTGIGLAARLNNLNMRNSMLEKFSLQIE